MKRFNPLLLLLAICISLNVNAQTIRYVKPGGTGNGSGWATAAGELKTVINNSVAGDSVFVATGTYNAPSGGFAMKEGVKIYGSFKGTESHLNQRIIGTTAADSSILSGQNTTQVIVNSGLTSAAVLDGFVITRGNSTASGSGMSNSSSSPTISNCSFVVNSSTSSFFGGGGMYNENNSSPIITNCIFSGNSASSGGGAIFNLSSSPIISNCVFSGNLSSSDGGGVYNYSSSSPTVSSCTFLSNSASFNGGGMYNYSSSSPIITKCIFSGNLASSGGGASSSGSLPIFINCAFSGNSAYSFGGGMSNSSSPSIITNCTFSGNAAGSYGGGMYNFGSSPVIRNCILYGDNTEIYNGGGSNPSISYGLIQGTAANTNSHILEGTTLSASNIFVNWQNPASVQIPNTAGNYSLKAGCPAINAGASDTTGLKLPATDLSGNLRVQGSSIDFGAYEFTNPLPLTLINFTVSISSNNKVLMQWQTAAETNTSYFTIERSDDGKKFADLGNVNAAGSGANNYSYNDNTPLKSGYYRLRIVDKNGAFVYSNVVYVSFNTPSASVTVFPNPAKNFITVVINNQQLWGSTATLFSSTGRALQKIQLSNNSTVVPINGYTAGTYLLKIQTGEVFKIVITQ